MWRRIQLEIRAITLHTDFPVAGDLEKEIEDRVNILENVREFVEEQHGLRVSSQRIALPYLRPSIVTNLNDILGVLKRFSENILFSGFALRSGNYELYNKLRKIVENGFYTSIILEKTSDVPAISRFLIELSKQNPLFATKIGVELSSGSLITPYFPLAVHKGSPREYLSLALLYNQDLLTCIENGRSILDCFWSVGKTVYAMFKSWKSSLPPLWGVDYSLSPWMEMSTARVLETLGNCVMGDLCCLSSVRRVNRFITYIAGRFGGLGFNEVMLPLAEDNVLKQRAREKHLGLKELVFYTTACLAGLDMVPVKLDEMELGKLIVVLSDISRMKNRPMGLRLIPLPKNFEKKEIELGIFGSVPVLEY